MFCGMRKVGVQYECVKPNYLSYFSISLWQLRPVVETGYENLLLVRLLVELQVPSVRKSSVMPLFEDGLEFLNCDQFSL